MSVPDPRPSPEVPADPFADTDSRIEGLRGHRSITGVWKQVDSTTLATKIQWGAIGAVTLSIATFVGWGINKMDMVNTASAQTQAIGNQALEASKTNSARIEAIDAGTRLAIERLERKIDASAENTDRKLAEILRVVRQK